MAEIDDEDDGLKVTPRWSPSDVEAVRAGLAKNYSAAMIARGIGKSRNAVIGYIYRHFRLHPNRETKEKILAKASAKRKALGIDKLVRLPKSMPRAASFGASYIEPEKSLVPVQVVDFRGGHRLLAIARNQCRFIAEKATGDYNPQVCGERTHGTTSWCLAHHRLVFVKKGTAQ
jgi:hypothetical protein